jgi:hypothetical protein
MTHTETLRLALEALKDLGNHRHDCPQWPTYAEPEKYPKCTCGYDQAITAIKASLEAKVEPVAWMDEYGRLLKYVDHICPTDTPLYTTPPQRKPLTDEEIEKIWGNRPMMLNAHNSRPRIEFVRAIEAAHGIK